MFTKFHAPIASTLTTFDEKFKFLVDSDFPMLKEISAHVFHTKGKQLRPLLLFYIYKLFKEEISESAYLAASLIEILHASSLIHDDVVDMADTRRGNPSVRFLWGNKAAILAGDYMLSNAFLKAYDHSDTRLMVFMVEVIRQMSEGELIQLEYTANPAITEDIYYQIIERKTAALFACCCRCGAHAAGASDEEILLAQNLGKNIGLAFQIQDDLLDLNLRVSAGKAYGNDLREGKITLPVLYYLRQASPKERNELWSILQSTSTKSVDSKELNETIEYIIKKINLSGVEADCLAQVDKFKELALLNFQKLNCPSPMVYDLISWICTTYKSASLCEPTIAQEQAF
ncbi:MAG: polyprenyl synthetase family protein [Bacteroidales bacterium]